MRAPAARLVRRAVVGIAASLLVAGLVVGAIFVFGSGTRQAAASKQASQAPAKAAIRQTTTTVPVMPARQTVSAVQPFVPAQLTIQALGLKEVSVKPAHTTTSYQDPWLGGKKVSAFPVPTDGTYVDWWQDGPAPGSSGLAILLGHNEIGGPGVFNNLGTLKPGDTITLTGQGQSLTMKALAAPVLTPKSDASALDTTLQHPPNGAHVALVSCAGTVNSALESHNDNVTIFVG